MQTNGRLAFFREFLAHPQQIGSVIPSSRFLERRVVRLAGINTARTVVELGPGNGGTTRALLRAMTPHARLLCIELSPRLHALTSRIQDPRLTVHLGSALSIVEILAQYGLPAPDAVVSGIPFSTMGDDCGSDILKSVARVLTPGGRFVAYQLSDRVAKLARPILGVAPMETEILNVPPMRVYRWVKPAPEARPSVPHPSHAHDKATLYDRG